MYCMYFKHENGLQNVVHHIPFDQQHEKKGTRKELYAMRICVVAA